MIAYNPKTSFSIANDDEGEESGVSAKITKISELEYLSDIVPQLHKMSSGLGESTLSYLFEMVMIEIRLQLDVEKYKANTLDY